MSIIVRPSREHTIALPEELMLKMHFAADEEILVQVEEDRLVLSKKTGSYTEKLRGLHKEVWESVDTEDFLEKERQSWNDQIVSGMTGAHIQAATLDDCR